MVIIPDFHSHAGERKVKGPEFLEEKNSIVEETDEIELEEDEENLPEIKEETSDENNDEKRVHDTSENNTDKELETMQKNENLAVSEEEFEETVKEDENGINSEEVDSKKNDDEEVPAFPDTVVEMTHIYGDTYAVSASHGTANGPSVSKKTKKHNNSKGWCLIFSVKETLTCN